MAVISPWDVCTVVPREPSAERGNRALAKPIKKKQEYHGQGHDAAGNERPFTKARTGRVQLKSSSNALVYVGGRMSLSICSFCNAYEPIAVCYTAHRYRTGKVGGMRALGCSGHSQLPFNFLFNFPCTEALLPACIFRNSVRKARKQFLRCEAVGTSGVWERLGWCSWQADREQGC